MRGTIGVAHTSRPESEKWGSARLLAYKGVSQRHQRHVCSQLHIQHFTAKALPHDAAHAQQAEQHSIFCARSRRSAG